MEAIIKKISNNKLYREISWSIATKGIAFIFHFALNIYLARKLGVEGFGSWSYFFSVFNIYFLFSLFGAQASKKFVAEHNYTDKLPVIVTASFMLRMALSISFAILFAILAIPLANVLDKPNFLLLFLYASPLIFLNSFTEYFKYIFIGLHRIKYHFIINIFDHFLKFCLVIALLFNHKNIAYVILAFIMSNILSFATGMIILKREKLFIWNTDLWNSYKEYIAKIVKYALPLLFLYVFFMLTSELDMLMLGYMTNEEEVGIYAIVKQIVVKLPQISIALSMGTMQQFAQLNNENRQRLIQTFHKLLKINTAIFGAITIGIFTLSWFFIPLIFGEAYTNSIYPLYILSIYTVCFSFNIFFNQFLDYQGLANKRAFNATIAFVLNITGNYLLIPQYGAIGAAIATSFSYLPYTLLNWREVKSRLYHNQ